MPNYLHIPNHEFHSLALGVPGQGLPCDIGQGFAKNEAYPSPLFLSGWFFAANHCCWWCLAHIQTLPLTQLCLCEDSWKASQSLVSLTREGRSVAWRCSKRLWGRLVNPFSCANSMCLSQRCIQSFYANSMCWIRELYITACNNKFVSTSYTVT